MSFTAALDDAERAAARSLQDLDAGQCRPPNHRRLGPLGKYRAPQPRRHSYMTSPAIVIRSRQAHQLWTYLLPMPLWALRRKPWSIKKGQKKGEGISRKSDVRFSGQTPGAADIAGAPEKREQVSERATVSRQARSSERTSGIDGSEKNFAVALAAYGALLGTGLYRLAEHDWWFGGIYTAGGALGLMSVTPLIRSKIGFLRSPRALWVAVSVTWLFLAANIGFSSYENFWRPQSRVPSGNPGIDLPEKWPARTTAQASALAERVRAIPIEDIVVACETLNCRDLADGIADILLKTEGWKVSVLHRGGFDITGVTGIRLNPNEPATQALKEAIESTTKLKVSIGPDTRKDIGSNQSFLTVGTRPF
jgi:hypothetical protein